MNRVNTVDSIWVCMIRGKFFVSKGHAAWRRKSDVVKAFKNSEFWYDVVDKLHQDHPDLVESSRYGTYWKYGANGDKLEAEAYDKLLKDGIVKYIEIEPIPEWVNI